MNKFNVGDIISHIDTSLDDTYYLVIGVVNDRENYGKEYYKFIPLDQFDGSLNGFFFNEIEYTDINYNYARAT